MIKRVSLLQRRGAKDEFFFLQLQLHGVYGALEGVETYFQPVK